MHQTRFALAWSLPLALMAALTQSGWLAWALMALVQLSLALVERLPGQATSPAAAAAPMPVHRIVLWGQALLQFTLLAFALACVVQRPMGLLEVMAVGLAVGGTTGSQGITFAHELGHSRSRMDRLMGWLLMGSVLYAHFMVEHYRGHHPRAATFDDPASARRGESLWRFLPRTLVGSWRSAWHLEAQQLARLRRPWWRSPLLVATVTQGVGLVALASLLGTSALVFWLVQSAYAVFLLETVNYIEHYGLRRESSHGRPEPFAVQHAWSADHWLTNSLLINLQRHSDHHMHAWKPYATLDPLPGPQLPTGYAGCLYMACVPRWWFAAMEPRLARLQTRTASALS